MSYGSCYGIPFQFGSGVLGPADPDSILQQLEGYVDGGFIDLKSIVDLPKVAGVSVLSFDGSDDSARYNVANSSSYPLRTGYWFKTTTVAQSVLSGFFDDTVNTEYAGMVEMVAGKLRVVSRNTIDGTSTTVQTSLTYNDGGWRRLDLYIANSTSVLLTVDDSDVLNLTGLTPVNGASCTVFELGRLGRLAKSLYFAGEISDVTADNGTPADVASFTLEEVSGATSYDTSGNGNDLTIDGATRVNDDTINLSKNLSLGFGQTVTTPVSGQTSFVLLGDSLTSQNLGGYETVIDEGDTQGYAAARGYFNWMRMYLSGQITLINNRGVGGETSSQILARVPDAISDGSDCILICAGTNDSKASSAPIIANLQSINDDIIAGGATPIWLNMPPVTAYSESDIVVVKEVNAFIAATFNHSVDVWSLIVGEDDLPVTGATLDDGTHWSDISAERIGRELAPIIESLASIVPFEWHDTTHACNVASNPTFANSANGWTTLNCTLETFTDSESLNNKLLLTATSDANIAARYTENISDGRFAIGDFVRMAVDIEWECGDDPLDARYWNPYIFFQEQKSDEAFILPTIFGIRMSSAQRVSGMSRRTSGRCTMITPAFEVFPTVDRIKVAIGFEQLPIGCTVKIHRYSLWTTNVAATESYPLVPALADGSGFDALGNKLTNLGGYTHNGFEGFLQQTHADFGIFGASESFWGDGLTVWDPKDYDDLCNHPNGYQNLWLKFDDEGFLEADKSHQYPLAKEFTFAEYSRNARFYGETPCGGIAPFIREYTTEGGDEYISEGGDDYIGE